MDCKIRSWTTNKYSLWNVIPSTCVQLYSKQDAKGGESYSYVVSLCSEGKRETNIEYFGGNGKNNSGLNLLELTEVINFEVGKIREKKQME